MLLVKKNLHKIIFLTFVVLMPILSFAQIIVIPTDSSTKLVNPIKAENINGFIKTLLEGALKVGMPIVALAVIYSGFLFVAARGNSEKINKAKETLMYTLIGAAVLLGSWAIAKLISETVLAL